MAFTCGFFNSVAHDRKYDAVQHGMIFDGIITDGIYATYLKAMVVKASENASEVIVQPGRAWFNHTWSYNDSDYPVAAPEPEVVLDRIDTLVLDVNSEDAVRNNQFLWVQGTPTSQTPEPPTLIHTATHNQYPLCDVYRQAGTTMIYAADITNRVGTSDCPFVTGVLESIDIDDLLAQWDDEFHTWENATKASFEGWMLNQQQVYTAWFNALKTQMAGDVEDVEAWVQTIKDIIDEETATHLQLEIDEINSMLPSGSHITVTTSDTELYSRTVTITDEDNNTVTSQFDANGVAVFKSVPYVGSLTITSTDGVRTATEVVSTPYFARYEFTLAFWSATVNIIGDSVFGGDTVTITDSTTALVGTVVLNASGTGVFNATYPDTYKFSVTHGGETMEVSLAVTQETTYNVEIHSGLNYQAWLNAGRVSKSFSSLDDVLEDEKTLRQLFLVHDAVDYVASQRVNNDLTKIFSTDLAAKWINNSDYALDKFYAVADIKTVMDTAGKYGYGEWCLMPQVPKMTSNTAPSGTASASSTYSGYDAYKAFDGSSSSFWSSSAGSKTNQRIIYHFTSSVKVAGVELTNASEGQAAFPKNCKVQYSTDGSTWVDAPNSSFVNTNTSVNGKTTKKFPASISAPYWCLFIENNQNNGNYIYVGELQFYAYAPKGNVPVMTANNAPYGEASADSAYSSYSAYRAFDGDYSTEWASNVTGSSASGQKLYYKFINPVCAKRVYFDITCTPSPTRYTSLYVIGSNNGVNWTRLGEFSQPLSVQNTLELENDNYYLYYGIEFATANDRATATILQFYGRELKVSVPTMTSNTAPFGEAIYSTYVQDGSNGYAWKAFDNDNSTFWHNNINAAPDTTSTSWIGYKFGIKTAPKILVYSSRHFNAGRIPSSIKLQGSDDYSTWTDIEDFTPGNAGSTLQYFSVTDNISYKALRVVLVNGSDRNKDVQTLQFYGKDYSEKEFEVGTTKKWLYDHGVEVESMEMPEYTGNSFVGSTIEKLPSSIKLNVGSNTYGGCGVITSDKINLSAFDLLRMKISEFGSTSSSSNAGMSIVSNKTGANPTNIANASFTRGDSNIPYNMGLNISSVNEEDYVLGIVGNAPSYSAELTELWLE